MARCLVNIAGLLYESGNTDAAIADAEEALRIFERLEDPAAVQVRQVLAKWHRR